MIFFRDSGLNFISNKKQLMLTYYIKYTMEIEDAVSAINSKLGINPRNTKDSIVEVITDNLVETKNLDIPNDVKELGYLMSINRL